MRIVLLAAVLSAMSVAAEPLATSELNSAEVRVSRLEVLRPARVLKESYLFTSSGKASSIRQKLRRGTRVYVTGAESDGRSEVWVEGIGNGWMQSSAIEVIEPAQ
ncbi:MAG TPA: hypothetical protein VFP46_02545 [Candidatus Paceibacterota bacterium]|nr:hypothetical protein [Candidatus Paceibacterota bacterium]